MESGTWQKENSNEKTIRIALGRINIKDMQRDESGNTHRYTRKTTIEKADWIWKQNVTALYTELWEFDSSPRVKIGFHPTGLANEYDTNFNYPQYHLPKLERFDWASLLGKETSLLNDTHSTLMAEATFGILQGMKMPFY